MGAGQQRHQAEFHVFTAGAIFLLPADIISARASDLPQQAVAGALHGSEEITMGNSPD